MHETAVAQSIIETILVEADKIGKKPIWARISCGQFNALNDEAMQFALDVASQDTPCKGIVLEIRHIPLRASCKRCQNEFEFDIYSGTCPACGSSEFDFVPDAPLLLEEIEFEDEDT
ncbi:MAG: hydrogenase maturation nickel metallochaperone HypA [Sedimentisphaerales bacterium]|nr:hydrogenase maturation nickel metallochaperone HypA [Sedimentisphaerales bacterium]